MASAAGTTDAADTEEGLGAEDEDEDEDELLQQGSKVQGQEGIDPVFTH